MLQSVLFKKILLVGFISLLLPTIVLGAKPIDNGKAQPFIFENGLHESVPVVEQQPGVINNTGCPWTIDDRVTWGGSGYIEPGEIKSYTDCLIADDNSHLLGLLFRTDAPQAENAEGLTVTIRYEPQDVEFALTQRPSDIPDYDWQWEGCIVGPVYFDRSTLPIVPNSNGGHGLRTDWTVTLTNTSSIRIRKISGGTAFGSSSPGSNRAGMCIGEGPPPPPYFQVGGAYWDTGL